MNRTGLIVALAIAVASGLVFGLFPQLDLWVARYFHGFVESGINYFAFRIYPPLMITRDIALWIPTLLIIPPVAALVIKLILPRRRMFVPGRAVLFLTVTLALGPGLLVNAVLKDHWGRPRPVDIIQFDGESHHVAWWDPRGDCLENCSFVSGDVSGTFWTIAPAALAPPQWRAVAYGAALTLGTGMGVLRVMAGGHFVSDVIFAGVFTFLIIWLVHGLIYRWPPTRLTDEGVERAIARWSLTGYIAARRVGRRVADEVTGPEDGEVADDADPHLKRRRRGWW